MTTTHDHHRPPPRPRPPAPAARVRPFPLGPAQPGAGRRSLIKTCAHAGAADRRHAAAGDLPGACSSTSSAARSPARTHEYLQFLLPGDHGADRRCSPLAIGVNLNTDIKKGVFDRFRSLPIARSAPLVGAVLGDMVRLRASRSWSLLGFGYVIGFRIGTDPLSAAGRAACSSIVFALCMCWVSVLSACSCASRARCRASAFLVLFPLTFGSQHVRADRHAARLAAGLGQRQPGHRT